MIVIPFVNVQIARAEKLLDDYQTELRSRTETKAELMAAFGLEDVDSELVLQEVDANHNVGYPA